MKPVLVVYATREGQTQRIAEHIGDLLRCEGLWFEVVNAAQFPPQLVLANYEAVIVGASLHKGTFETEIEEFATRHCRELSAMPTMFLSVSLAQVAVDDPNGGSRKRAESEGHIRKTMEDLFAKTGWRPSRTLPVAGALRYTKYGLLTRFLMKRASALAGRPTDTSRDYEFTNWAKLDDSVGEFVASLVSAVSM